MTTEIAELKCLVQLVTADGAASSTNDFIPRSIGVVGGGVVHLGQVTSALFGTVVSGTMACLEGPTFGDTTIFLVAGDRGTEEALGVINTVGAFVDSTLTAIGVRTGGDVLAINVNNLLADEYLYLVGGQLTQATYGHGKFLLTFQCRYTVPYPA